MKLAVILVALLYPILVAAAPPPIPTEELGVRIHVRGFLNAIEWKRYHELPMHVSDDAVLLTWDGAELRSSELRDWMATEFVKDGCHPLIRTDAGHLNDNSIFFGQDDGNMVEYRPIGCSKSRFRSDEPTHSRKMALRFTSPLNGKISKIEIIK